MSLGDNWDVGAGPNGVGAEFDVPKCSEGVAGCSLEDGHWVASLPHVFIADPSAIAVQPLDAM